MKTAMMLSTLFVATMIACSLASASANTNAATLAGPITIDAPASAAGGTTVPVNILAPSGAFVTIRTDTGTVLYDSDTAGTSGATSIAISLAIPAGAAYVDIEVNDGAGAFATHRITVT